jgi:4-hydroxy-tetrahydrodipicolinate synthase
MAIFRGALTALITPFREGRIDEKALTALVDEQIAAGIDGLVPCGTTGESPTLSHAEHVRVVEIVMRAADGRVPVLAGAGSNSTREAIDLTRACKELGVTGTLQITPYYNKPPQAGLVRHFTAIADAVGLPMVVYNVPGRTGVDLQPETVAELARHEMVRGIKEATGDMDRLSRIRELVSEAKGDGFDLLSGDDFTLLPFLAAGGHGVISVVSNVVPKLIANLCEAAAKGDVAAALRLHDQHIPLTRALFRESNPIPIKAAMSYLGRCENEPRLPLRALEPDSPLADALREALKNIGANK